MINQFEIERDYIDARTAGKLLELSPSRISRLCSGNRFIGAFKAGGSWLIPRVAVENFTRLKPGPKPKTPSDREIWANALTQADNLKGDC